ncbi:MAG: hypothetical protein ACREO1_09825 [Arenimonas sp.]
MSKRWTALIVVLVCVIGIQARLLYEANHPAEKTGNVPVQVMANEHTDPVIVQNDISNQLARIDARLAALEATKSTAATNTQREIILGSPEAIEADRKIAALLPDGPMTQQELFLFQSQLAQYPSDEKAHLSAALARAINNGQVEIAANR